MDPSNPLISTDSVDQWITDISINEVAISCMALHTNTNGLWRLARRMLGQLPTQATFAIVFWLPGHYGMLGVHVDQVSSFHVLLGNRGPIPPMIEEFLVIIESLTEVPVLTKHPGMIHVIIPRTHVRDTLVLLHSFSREISTSSDQVRRVPHSPHRMSLTYTQMPGLFINCS